MRVTNRHVKILISHFIVAKEFKLLQTTEMITLLHGVCNTPYLYNT